MARISVTRTIVIEGEEKWVRATLDRSWVAPDRPSPLDTFDNVGLGADYQCIRELARDETVLPDHETRDERQARWEET